jgi:hypothetical protein
MKRIVYTNPNTNAVHVIVPAPEFENQLEAIAAKDVPTYRAMMANGETAAEAEARFGVSDLGANVPWRIVDVAQLPASRNWRNAWTDANPTDTVDVDLEKAKQEHLNLMVSVAAERVQPNAFGQRDFSQVEAEIEALRPQVEAATTLTELYNLWPASISKRSGQREYVVHKA